jgi:stearoyl-CoA desaturase (delta-9 desaturase)
LWATIILVLLSTAGTGAAVFWSFWYPPGLLELALFTGMWVWTQLGGAIAFHRYFSHRSFEATPLLTIALGITGSMMFQGPIVYWVVLHRRHHEYSDEPGDPHSPRPLGSGWWGRVKGLWHAHVGWMAHHDLPNPLHYAPDLLRDRLVMGLNRGYLLFAVAGLALPAGIGGAVTRSWEGAISGLLWGGFVRLFACYHLTWIVNSLGHTLGRRDFSTEDESRNVTWLALPTFGESWHNNHHAFPSSACNRHRWWQLDLAYLMIWLLARTGLASNVRVATARSLAGGSTQGTEGDGHVVGG